MSWHLLYDSRDVFLTTGFGKSICFKVLPVLFVFKVHTVGISMLNQQYLANIKNINHALAMTVFLVRIIFRV